MYETIFIFNIYVLEKHMFFLQFTLHIKKFYKKILFLENLLLDTKSNP